LISSSFIDRPHNRLSDEDCPVFSSYLSPLS
jgi:hypothetical protein